MSDVLKEPVNLYEDLTEDTTFDYSCKGLEEVPTLRNEFVRVLYLQNNKIKTLPENFFNSLPNLMWLDLRDNELIELPKYILNHPSLTHLLLQNNKLTVLPSELGTVHSLKVLQLSGNPITYPPQEVLKLGTRRILDFLYDEYSDKLDFDSEDTDRYHLEKTGEEESHKYNYEGEAKSPPLTVKVNERESGEDIPESSRSPRYCPRFRTCRKKVLPHYTQSRRYVKPFVVLSPQQHEARIKHNLRKQAERNKQINVLASREKTIQDRKNKELLKNWRINYKNSQYYPSYGESYSMDAKKIPYDTSPEYMTLLSREDIERDLPDKYKKSLVRKSKPSICRKNQQDVQLAIKIRELFKTLEAIDLHRENMTPRTEQKVLKDEIKKITEIKQKLAEFSCINTKSFLN